MSDSDREQWKYSAALFGPPRERVTCAKCGTPGMIALKLPLPLSQSKKLTYPAPRSYSSPISLSRSWNWSQFPQIARRNVLRDLYPIVPENPSTDPQRCQGDTAIMTRGSWKWRCYLKDNIKRLGKSPRLSQIPSFSFFHVEHGKSNSPPTESTSNSFIMEPITCLMMGVGLVFSLIVLQFLWQPTRRVLGIKVFSFFIHIGKQSLINIQKVTTPSEPELIWPQSLARLPRPAQLFCCKLGYHYPRSRRRWPHPHLFQAYDAQHWWHWNPGVTS